MQNKKVFFVVSVVLSLVVSVNFCYASISDEEVQINSQKHESSENKGEDYLFSLNKKTNIKNLVEDHKKRFPYYEGSDYDIISQLKSEKMEDIVQGKIRAYRRNYPYSNLSDQYIFDLFDRSKNDEQPPELEYIEEDKQTVTYSDILLFQTSDADVLDAGGDRFTFVKKQIVDYKQARPTFVLNDYDILDYFKSMILQLEAADYTMTYSYHNGHNQTEIYLKEMLDDIYEHNAEFGLNRKECESFLLTTYEELLAADGNEEGYEIKTGRVDKFGLELEMQRVRTEIEANENLQDMYPGSLYRSVFHEGEIAGGVKKIEIREEDANEL